VQYGNELAETTVIEEGETHVAGNEVVELNLIGEGFCMHFELIRLIVTQCALLSFSSAVS